MELRTVAEQKADKARDLPAFRSLSLPGVRQQVATLLSLIGREGIFSTYTVHDISHIDAMLKMVDWLIPPSTAKIMTATDWLLVVLAIYLHDLGMLVTSAEYHSREDNAEYVSWFQSLSLSPEGREYVARVDRMTADEKDRFFFQEFVRKGHAQRVKEWITGRHSWTWGPDVKPISDAIREALHALPVRFKDYLGAVCESHHRSDLDKTSAYPLIARLGNDPQETANIQYAAIILRTADLLHVTKDRTPSAMYQLVRFTDPKSVDEWDKQLGAFAVGPKGRELDENDPTTAVVVINADFTEERPLFALQEYVAYADAEVKQSKRWIEKSQQESDGRDYGFPWHEVTGDIRLEGVPPQPLRLELNRGRLLDLLVGHTIYNDATVAVRELLQNAIDAVRFQHYLSIRTTTNSAPVGMGTVRIRWNSRDRLLIVEDDGVGMDKDTIKHHLMSVGSSYYNTTQFELDNKGFAAISRFGIGILTCFMLSDDVEIITVRENIGHRIRMTSVHSTYLLRRLDSGDPKLAGLGGHGTRVIIRLRTTVDLHKQSMVDIIKYWIILPECAVEYFEASKPAETIGFTSPAKALEHFYALASNDRSAVIDASIEFVTKVLETSERLGEDQVNASYELSFAVTKDRWFPERSFALLSTPSPAVCIEGIRVSDSLPGFGKRLESVLCWPFAVPASSERLFRELVLKLTTSIGESQQCVRSFFFHHINDEVLRISNQPGRPLSVASTSARWLFNAVTRASNQRVLKSDIDMLRSRQPSIVMEQIHNEPDQPPRTERLLVSSQDLRNVPSFWTIESRSVDLLGIISRDLGKELSLNDFLAALAPDVTRFRYSPLLPDAHEWAETARASHRPNVVEFSREHQQSAIQWTLHSNKSESMGLDLESICAPGMFSLLREYASHQGIQLYFPIACSQIQGDDPRVTVVITRIGTILQANSRLASLWGALKAHIAGLAAETRSVTLLRGAIKAAGVFNSFLGGRLGGGPVRRDALDTKHSLLRYFDEANISGQLPDDWQSALRTDAIFDARRYWLSWDRRESDSDPW